MRSFLIKYDFSRVASGKILETVIIHGEVTVIAQSAAKAKEQALFNGMIPTYVMGRPNCIEVWEHTQINLTGV